MPKEKNFIQKHWSNIIFVIILILVIIPQTRQPIQVFLNRMIAFSPSEINETDRETLNDYEWYFKDEENKTVNFTQSKGKLVLVNYWATWCAPCIAEMPDLQKLYTDYKEEVDFYFITSEAPEVVEPFLERENYTLPPYYFLSSPPNVLKSSSLPTTFLIGKDGDIIIKKTGAANWNSKTVRATIDKLK
ncbi:TlpA family protein disulfide reductase [Psychroflexus montanilacus]|uniref:TlpA family protein disulfide reductase n=1 Tax=Psychroflexus montanilacus TaxID=2873598 RepID=UPI001CCCF3E2|nr:TlpA disulfide reductase family protein [Psychroflexus montanilacus]MBZ9651997.1 TlpA family protein disulfide reductase [Psychroflexus montanilacus]